MKNNSRYDLSDWLLHFFRDVDFNSGSGMPMPERLGWCNIFEYDNKPTPAFFLLRCAIRQQRIWATWAYREGFKNGIRVRNIYGKKPAVCFTEMPIAAFLETSEARQERGEHISSYAIAVNKTQLAKHGALPVIYGLSQQYKTQNTESEERVIDPSCLPLMEQYRYVAYVPHKERPIDWTHEREWRWAYNDDIEDYNAEMLESGVVDSFEDVPSLDLLSDGLSGSGIIVSNDHQAKLILSDLLSLIDSGLVARKKYSFILSLSRISSPKDLIDPSKMDQAISEALIDPLAGLEVDERTIAENYNILEEISAQLNTSIPTEKGEPGTAWLWLYDGAHIFTRSMIASNRVMINKDGRYLLHIREFTGNRGLRQLEFMVQQLASTLKSQVGVDCGYFSVLGHCDPNGVPFYCEASIDNEFVYNNSWS